MNLTNLPLTYWGKCEQGCGRDATVYALDPIPNGWGGRYCEPCAKSLHFQIVDRLTKETT